MVKGQDVFMKRSELGVGWNGAVAILTIIAGASLAVAFFRFFDGLFAGSTLVSQFLVIGSGQALISTMIGGRKALQSRWGERAFSTAFRWLAIPGLTLVFAGVVHFAFIEGARILPREVATIPVLYLILSGVVLWARSILVFGLDNLSLMYIYYPAESSLVDAQIYGVLRHPVYSGVMRAALALVLCRGSLLAIFAWPMTLLTAYTWLWLVEERELVERFGDGYRQYRAKTPAFFNLNPRTWPILWKFLLTGR